MRNEGNKGITENALKEQMRAEMKRMRDMSERAERGQATDSEIAEIKALDEKINSVPDDVIRG